MDLPTPSWGDEVVGILPPPEESAPDKDGVRTITKYRATPDGGTEKVTQRVKTVRREIRKTRGELRRANIPQFGLAATSSGENVTYVAADEVHIEKPGTVVNSDPLLDPSTQAMFACRHCGKVGDHWSRMCPFKELVAAGGTVPDDLPPSEDGPKPGVYRPPIGSSSADDDDDSRRTLKVMNLSKEAQREDLYELFGVFGSIERVTLVRDRDTGENRGMAFVCFRMREDGERALEALDGHPYEYQILSIEWAKPRSERAPMGGSLANMRVTGYGKALPQGMGPGR